MRFDFAKLAAEILSSNDEFDLEYLVGRQYDSVSHLHDVGRRWMSPLMRFVKKTFGNLAWISACPCQSVDYFIYLGTNNQADALAGFIASAQKLRRSVALVCERAVLKDSPTLLVDGVSLQLTFSDIINAGYLFAIFFPRLAGQTRARREFYKMSRHWDRFFLAYVYLPYFCRRLHETNPSLIIVANDHNLPNRCLIACARQYDIPTVYLQHASVSPLFPALGVDYALLDGWFSLETYFQCIGNSHLQSDQSRSVAVFLTGQKKRIRSDLDARKVNPSRQYVGVAVNALDTVENVRNAVSRLSKLGHAVRLRWHPGSERREIRRFKQTLSGLNNVSFSNPAQESISKFLTTCRVLISGNSSIHLEAAQNGITPIYFEFSPSHQRDYYRYVANGVSLQAFSIDHLIRLLDDIVSNSSPSIDADAIGHYSATHRTRWEGNEGELVAKLLDCITSESSFDHLFEKIVDSSLPERWLEVSGQRLEVFRPR